MARVKGTGEYRMIKIIRITATKGATGNIVESEATLYEGWADVENLSGSRRFFDRPLNEKTYRFKIKNRPLIVPVVTDTVIYQGNRLSVQDVSRSDEKKFTYEIIANKTGFTYPAGGLVGDGLITEGGDLILTEGGDNLILE